MRRSRASQIVLWRALREFYEAQARTDIGRWLPHYLPGLPRAPVRIRLKIMSSQWGSLSPDGSLALDLALLLALYNQESGGQQFGKDGKP